MKHTFKSNLWMMLPTAVAALAIGDGAYGQTAMSTAVAGPQQPAQMQSAVAEVVVTATRVDRKGFVAPTPTITLSQSDLRVGGHNNIADVIDDLPQAMGLYGGNNGAADTTNVIGGASFGNLRDLNPNRTLVLIDGARPTPTEFSATILGFDLNMIPLALVKKVDVVTGGASASWGSDAIAGVVNILLDDNFVGVKADAQGGGSTQGIGGQEVRVDLAGGTNFADGRGHVMAGVGYDYRPEIGPLSANGFTGGLVPNPAYTATNGQPQDIFVLNRNASNASIGGLITSGPLKGTDFGPGGSVGTFLYGADAGASFMSGGDASAYNQGANGPISEPLQRENFYGRASWDVNNNTVLTADLLLGHTLSNETLYDTQNLGNISIGVNNAYLPAQIKSLMAKDKLSTISLGTINSDFPELNVRQEAYTEQFKFGGHGTFSNNWSWDSFASYGATERSLQFGPQEITANFANSVNAVVSPTTGQPVCAIALTNPSTNCVPVDLFGPGSASSAAESYFLGNSILRMDFTQVEVAANLRGTPFSLWAGPVSVATGLEFRSERVTAHTDAITAAGGFTTFNAGTLSDGGYNVTEGYLEAVAPLIRNTPLLEAVDFDGGVRVSGYTTTGIIPSWKFGLTDQVTSEIRVRGEYSRDIRAPNLAELYLKRSTAVTTVVDPSTNASDVITSYGGGNTNLKAETANTVTLGVIYNPNWQKNLNISLDYYNIDLENAISTLTAQLIVNECYQGVSAVCGQITRVNGVISTISATEINIASYKLSGFDLEGDYTTDLAALHIPGKLGLRLLATYVDTLKENTGSSVVNLAGDITNGTPRVRGTATLTYALGPLQFLTRARYVEGGAYSKQITVNVSVPDATYVDLGVQCKIPRHEGYVLYADVDNVANSLNPINSFGTFYDLLGRTFDVGMRVQF